MPSACDGETKWTASTAFTQCHAEGGGTDVCPSKLVYTVVSNVNFEIELVQSAGIVINSLTGAVITAWAVALSCYISHGAMHRKKADFEPLNRF